MIYLKIYKLFKINIIYYIMNSSDIDSKDIIKFINFKTTDKKTFFYPFLEAILRLIDNDINIYQKQDIIQCVNIFTVFFSSPNSSFHAFQKSDLFKQHGCGRASL